MKDFISKITLETLFTESQMVMICFKHLNQFLMFVIFKNIKEQKLVDRDMLERRKHPNLTHKEQMQINAHRYTEIFKLAKESKNPEFVFRHPDMLIENCT